MTAAIGFFSVPANHDLRVYLQILSRVDLGTPQLHAVRWEPDSETYCFLPSTNLWPLFLVNVNIRGKSHASFERNR